MRHGLAAVLLFLLPLSAEAADCGGAAEPGKDWGGCNRSNLMLSGSDLSGAKLVRTNLSQTDLRKAVLTQANLEDAKLAGTSLAGSLADGANFTKVEGYRVDFSGVSAKGAAFKGAELQRSSFKGAALADSSFEKAELGRVSFEGAALANNSFAYANLARADLRKARIEGPLAFGGAYMFLTHIEGADLSGATGLEQAQIDVTCGNDQTKLPAGLKPSAKWPCPSD